MRDEDMYAEVWEIVSHFNTEERDRIPDEILRLLDLERNRDYVSRIDPQNLLNPANIHQRTINFLTWLMMDYMASPEEREELIRIGKENDRKNGLADDTPEEKPANSMTGRTDHTADGNLNYCYYELLDIEDCALRKTAFKQLESKCSDVYSFDGTDELEVFSNFLALRLKGPLTIEGDQCKVPVEYWCTDPYGDVWQNIGIYERDGVARLARIDYMKSFTDTVFKFRFEGEDFLIAGIDTSCVVETSERDGMILLGIDVSSVPVADFPVYYKEIVLDNEADWNELPVQSFELEIAGTRLPLRCKEVEPQLVHLTLDENHAEGKYSFTVSDLAGTKIIINMQESGTLKSYAIPCPLSDVMECFGFTYLNLPDLRDETGLELDFL